MTDIVERLRKQRMISDLQSGLQPHYVCLEAADEIERLREALRALVIAVEYKGPPVDFGEGNLCWEARVPLAFVDNARAALGEEK